MGRPNKKHHKIPRVYLEGFTGSDGKLWVADKNLKIFAQSPHGLLTENDYYTIRFPSGSGTLDIETKYLGGIEASYGNLFVSKISKLQRLTDEEKAILSIFVASMLERQPASRIALDRFFADVKEHVEHLKMIPPEKRNVFAAIPPSDSEGIPADVFLEAGKDVASLHTSLIPGTVTKIAPIIFQMHWAFIVRPDSSNPFITSDNPCVMVNPPAERKWGKGTFGSAPGLAQKHIELTLPLSSDVSLLCGWEYKGDLEYVQLPSEYITDTNQRTSRHASILIGRDKAMLERIVSRIKQKMDKGNKPVLVKPR